MLENGIEALLIRDEKTDKAAAALDVKAGHLADPEDLQGLAHFCEHLLFMGTEKVSSIIAWNLLLGTGLVQRVCFLSQSTVASGAHPIQS